MFWRVLTSKRKKKSMSEQLYAPLSTAKSASEPNSDGLRPHSTCQRNARAPTTINCFLFSSKLRNTSGVNNKWFFLFFFLLRLPPCIAYAFTRFLLYSYRAKESIGIRMHNGSRNSSVKTSWKPLVRTAVIGARLSSRENGFNRYGLMYLKMKTPKKGILNFGFQGNWKK